MLHLLHTSARLGLNDSILRQSLMSILKFPNLLLFELDLTHFPMVVGNLFVVIVICRLLVFFNLVYRLLFLVLFTVALGYCLGVLLRELLSLQVVKGPDVFDLLWGEVQTRHLGKHLGRHCACLCCH